MIPKTACITALWLVCCSAFAADMLTLSFSEKPAARGKVYGTSAAPTTPTISTRSGERVLLQQQSGRDYQLQGTPLGRAWTQVQQVPRQATSLAVTPLVEGDRVTLDIEYSRKEADDALEYSGRVNGALGEWIPLLQGGSQGATGVKTWSAGKNASGLSVRVERQEAR